MGAGCAKNVAGEPQRTAVAPFPSATPSKPPSSALQSNSRLSSGPLSGIHRACRGGPPPQLQQAAAAARRGSRVSLRRPSSAASAVSAASAATPRRHSEARSPTLQAAPPVEQPQQAQPQLPPQSLKQQEPLPAGFSYSTGQPPHHMLSGELTRISCGLVFHVRVYGMKARGLDVTSNTTATCLRLEWAAPLTTDKSDSTLSSLLQQKQQRPGDAAEPRAGEALVLTTQPVKGRSPKWLNAFEFTWHTPSLEHLQGRALVFSVVERPTGQGDPQAASPPVVGRGAVSLFSVATGPVHHDVLLRDADGSSQTGRLIMDVRMQQICDLVINPIEILAHLGDSASSTEDEEATTDDEADVTTEEGASPTGSSPTEGDGEDSPQKNSHANAKTLRRLVTKSEVFCRARGPHLHSFASRSHNFRCGERQRRQAAAAANRAARAARAAEAAGQNGQTEDGTDEGGPCAASPPPERGLSVASSSSNASDRSPHLEREGSSPREMDEEEPEPLSAHWLLSFSPTGVDNPRESFSVETENVQQPYWNAVDHALLGHRLKAGALSGISVVTAPATTSPRHRQGRGDREKQKGAIGRGVQGSETNRASVTLQPASDTATTPEGSLSGAENVPAAEASYRRALDRMLSVSGELQGSRERAASAEEPLNTGGSSSWRTLSPPISRRQTQRHLGHLDPKSTYQKLAAVAAKGDLVKEVLHDTFPTLHLSTTIDQLRQHYLRIRLHAKVFASDTPSLFGECWLPFFKVYDADLVTSVPRQFYDSYFREKLWLDGKHVGVLEGIIVFQNNPVVRQVCAGVQTEKGLCRIFPPVLGHEHRPVCFKFTGAANSVPPPVARIAELHEKLLHLITRKTQHKAPDGAPVASAVTALLTSVRKPSEADPGGAKTLEEAKAACDELLQLLNASDVESRRSFLFASEAELLRSQRVLLNLANHTLEFLEYVFWQCRASYCAVLCAILRRGELDLGTVLPSRPDACAALTLSEVYVLYSSIKAENAEAAAAAAAASGSSGTASSGGLQGGKQKLFVSQRSIEFDSGNITSSSSTAGSTAKPAGQQQGGRISISNALLPRLGGDGDGPKGYLGVALQRLKNAGVAVVPAGDAEAAAQLGRELGGTKLGGNPGSDEIAAWKAQHTTAVSKERTEQLNNFAKSLSAEARFNALLYHKRLKLCRQFRLLLHRVLAAALRMLGGEASFGGQRRFACMLLAMTYFRLPDFRSELLRSVLTSEGRSAAIEEWRGTEFLLDAASLEAAESWAPSSPLRILLQWEIFHSTLKDYFGAGTLQEDIDAMQGKLSPEPDWRKELGAAGSSFFAFLEQWVRCVIHGAPPKTCVDWREIPGYSTLLKRLLLELKARSVTKYPDSLVNCTGAMLANEKLLSVFVKIVFLRTHAHNSPQVFSALTYVDFWAQLLASRGRQLPPNFDFAFLRKGLQLIIDSDLYANVSKGLWFVYRNLPILNGEQLEEILIDLFLRRHGLRLFMHWAWIVRRAFMWVLLYRLVEGMRRVIGRITGLEPSFANSRHLPQQPQQQQQGGASVALRRVALSREESVVIKGHSVFVAFLRALSMEEILPPDAVRATEEAEAEIGSGAASSGGPGWSSGSPCNASPSQQLFEGSMDDSSLQVYKRQAVMEFNNEVAAYKAWVAEGAAALPMMIIPSAPLDAHTDVPLEGWQ